MTQAFPPIRKELVVEAPIERAFAVFTARMTAWWPKTHHIGTSPLVESVVEPKVDGRWYERCEDGSECEWGKVLAWDPPHRLILAWQLDPEFRYDPSLITEVEVRFTALGPSSTRVDFEHRDLERFGEYAVKTGPMMAEGWGMILDSFSRTAAGRDGDQPGGR